MRPVQRLPAYLRHAATGQARVIIEGRTYYLGAYGSLESQARYRDLLIEHLRTVPRTLTQQAARDPELTVGELSVAFWEAHAAEWTKPDGKLLPHGAHYQLLIRSLRWMHGDVRVRDFGPVKLTEWRDFAITHAVVIDDDGTRRPVKRTVKVGDGNAAKPLARKTANDWLNRARSIFRWGVANELVPAAVLQALEAVAYVRRGRSLARETPPVRPVPDHHVLATLPYLPRVVRDAVIVQRLTGARCGEIVAMRPCDIDRGGPEGTWIYRPLRHKGSWRGHAREIVLDASAQQVLAPYLDRAAERCCFSPRDSEAERNEQRAERRRVKRWPSHDRARRRQRRGAKARLRDHYDVDGIRRAIERAVAQAKAAGLKVEAWSPHRLRHSTATELRARTGADSARAVLGHHDLDATSIYAQRDLGVAARALASFDRSAWLRVAGAAAGSAS